MAYAYIIVHIVWATVLNWYCSFIGCTYMYITGLVDKEMAYKHVC